MSNTTPPSHEDIARRAQEIWNERGSPGGRDTEIWFEAERQLAGSQGQSQNEGAEAEPSAEDYHSTKVATRVAPSPNAKNLAEHQTEIPRPTQSPDAIAAQSVVQKKAARLPKLPAGKSAPKPTPPESGKPVWDKPHSS